MIVIVFPQFYGVHGIARYIQSYLLARDPSAEKLCVIAGDEEVRDLGIRNVEFIHLPMPKGRLGLIRWSWAMRQALIRLAATGQVSLVNFHIPPLLPGLFLPRVAPLVVTAHTTYLGMSGRFYQPRQFESQWSWLSVTIKMWFERIIFAKADALITLTEQGRQELLRYRRDKPIDLIPNGVVAEHFTPDNTVQKDVDVLFAGRIEQRKGSRPMVAICKALVAAKPDIRISVVGYGDDMAYVTAELANLSANVTLHGKVPFDEVLHHYRRSRIYASASYYEGLPGTCLEAMAAGLPVIAWDYLFYRSVVVHQGNGILIQVNDISSFCDETIHLLSDRELQSSYGKSGILISSGKFNWKILSRNLDALFKRRTAPEKSA